MSFFKRKQTEDQFCVKVKGKSVRLIGGETLAVTPAGNSNYTTLHRTVRARKIGCLEIIRSPARLREMRGVKDGSYVSSERVSKRLQLHSIFTFILTSQHVFVFYSTSGISKGKKQGSVDYFPITACYKSVLFLLHYSDLPTVTISFIIHLTRSYCLYPYCYI